MPTITILGVVFPSGVVVDTMRFTGTFFENNHAPALRYALQVIDSNVIVQWTMDEYDPDGDQSQYVTRALELARAIVDPIAFREGVGLLVYLTELVKPDGTQMELIHGHNELRDIVTAFPEEDPGIFQRMLLGDPFLCRAVNDLIFAINAGGPRMAAYLQSLSRGVFHDAKPADFLALYYKMMNYQEAPFDQLGASGLSPDYVAKETKRALAGVAGETKIYPGIDIDVPVLGAGPAATDKKTKPEDVSRALRAAFGAGADGVVLSREYVEMWLANLTAAGDTLREIFAQAASKS